MGDRKFYDSVGLLEEARRYETSPQFLEFLYHNFKGIGRLLSIGIGSRLLTISSALPKELYGVDVNQGSIDRAKEFARLWKDYRGFYPFSAEFDFLDKRGLSTKFDNCKFYLAKDFPKGLEGTFDGVLASELFLHMTPKEVKECLAQSYKNLKPDGKLVFTFYPSGRRESLDEKFCELARGIKSVRMNRRNLVQGGRIDIKTLAPRLKENAPITYRNLKERYWLDLEAVYVFPEEEMFQWCKDAGFQISMQHEIRCGMFPFAHRWVCSVEKSKS